MLITTEGIIDLLCTALKFIKFASIDVGSNAVRILFTNVFETPNGPVFRKLSLIRVPIRLGEDAFTQKMITAEKAIQLVKTMQSFRHLMIVHRVQAYKAYATSAMRESFNSEEVVRAIKDNTDIDLEIVTGDVEAQTISTSDIPDPLPKFRDAVFVDVGGGSTEMTYLKDGEVHDYVSFKIGTIRLLHETVDESTWKQFNDWFVKNDLLDSRLPIIGTGGNINKLLKMLRKESTHYYIASEDLSRLYFELNAMDYDERIVKYILNPDRADVIVPACKIFLSVIENLGSDTIYIPKVGLSDGIARTLYKEFKAQNN